MKTFFKICLAIICLNCAALAETNRVETSTSTNAYIPILKMKNGDVYTEVDLTVINTTNAILRFPGGGAKILLWNLPEPWRAKFYDPDKYAQLIREDQNKRIRQLEAAKLAQAEAKIRYKENYGCVVDGKVYDSLKLPVLEGKVISVLDGAVLLMHDDGTVFHVKGGSRNLVDGSYLNVAAKNVGRFQYTSASGALKTVASYDIGTRYRRP